MATKKRDTRTVAQRNKQMRQEALREQLAEQCRLQHVIDNIRKMEDVSGEINPLNANIEQLEFQRIKAANEQRIKLMGKYLPDMKSVEHSGEIGHIHEQDTVTIEDRIAELIEAAEGATAGSPRTH